jgi:hypothetical protein
MTFNTQIVATYDDSNENKNDSEQMVILSSNYPLYINYTGNVVSTWNDEE